jgi:membrane protease YdiL (CAAX protease family)
MYADAQAGVSTRGTFHRPRTACAIAASLALLDLAACYWRVVLPWHRLVLAGAGAVAVAWLSGFDRQALGLVLRPIQGYRYWVKAGVGVGVSVMAFCLLVLAVMRVVGLRFPLRGLPPQEAFSFACYACLGAPMHEELLYRFVLCLPVAAVAGRSFTIVAGGAVFAALHFAYGNPAPTNFVAGFFLCWAYLRSGTLFVPIVFHALGNAFVVAAQLAIWYWVH